MMSTPARSRCVAVVSVPEMLQKQAAERCAMTFEVLSHHLDALLALKLGAPTPELIAKCASDKGLTDPVAIARDAFRRPRSADCL